MWRKGCLPKSFLQVHKAKGSQCGCRSYDKTRMMVLKRELSLKADQVQLKPKWKGHKRGMQEASDAFAKPTNDLNSHCPQTSLWSVCQVLILSSDCNEFKQVTQIEICFQYYAMFLTGAELSCHSKEPNVSTDLTYNTPFDFSKSRKLQYIHSRKKAHTWVI